MQIEVFKSKIHRVTITEANLSYVGSITIDEDLLDAANMIAGEKVQIVNVNNGERLETYIIKGERGSVSLDGNDPAAVNAHGVEEGAVLRRVAPQVCCIDSKAILLYKKCAG